MRRSCGPPRPGHRPGTQRQLGLALDAAQVPDGEFLGLMNAAGLRVIRTEERSASYARVAARLCAAVRRFGEDGTVARDAGLGHEVLRHERWATWLAEERVRKLAVLAKHPPDTP